MNILYIIIEAFEVWSDIYRWWFYTVRLTLKRNKVSPGQEITNIADTINIMRKLALLKIKISILRDYFVQWEDSPKEGYHKTTKMNLMDTIKRLSKFIRVVRREAGKECEWMKLNKCFICRVIETIHLKRQIYTANC
jgi:hypothetical protein